VTLFDRTLARLRKLCLALPETSEVQSWGHPNFRAGKRIFAVLEVYRGQLSLCVRPDPATYRVLAKDSRFYVTPYIGNQGWLSLKVDGPLDWAEVRTLVLQSYRQVALKRMLAALDDAASRPGASAPYESRPAGRRTARVGSDPTASQRQPARRRTARSRSGSTGRRSKRAR